MVPGYRAMSITAGDAIFTKLKWFFCPSFKTNKAWALNRTWDVDYSPEVQSVFHKVSLSSLTMFGLD